MKKLLFFISIFLITGCSNITVLDPKSETGKDQAFLIWLSTALMVLVILVVFVLFTYFVIKYREKPGKSDTLPIDVKGNMKLELTYTIIPIILLIVLAVPTVKITMEQSPSKTVTKNEEGRHIEVLAKQFEWSFQHPNGERVADELVVPEGEPLVFHLTSEDVIHSFWIPELAGKVDVIPGNQITYVIDDAEVGTYQGKCAEYCGIQHTNMNFTVKVVEKDEYINYLNDIEEEDEEEDK
ncbi:MAG TPA: cytochrome c oxidase subunit II [Pseudogracilibacillus sp.]|nr:cytochrome c oxidase subunit II [Pseudogracilibacillus sp.]